MSFMRPLVLPLAAAALALWQTESLADATRPPQPLPQATQPSAARPPVLARDDVDDVIVNGTQSLIGAAPGSRTSGPRDVTLNYPNVDIHEVAKSILGDLLGLNYFVDQAVSGTVTVVTAEPVARRDVLPIFESSLKAANLALVRQGKIYTIVSLATAKKQTQLISGAVAGYGTEAVPLHYVNPTELKKLLDPVVPENGILQVDAGRNLLFITGTGAERQSMRDLIRQFDVNWMRGMSFALFVPKHSDSRSVAAELEAMINAPGSPAAAVVRLLSIDRLNAVLAITSEPRYLKEIKNWISVLDRLGGENERRLFVYRVQNGRAIDLAKALTSAFGQAGNANNPNGSAAGANKNNTTQPSGFQAPSMAQPTQPMTAGVSTAGGEVDSLQLPSSSDNTANVSQTVSVGDTEHPVTISSDETNNAVLVFGTARQYAIVQDALYKLDLEPLQVLIDASIVEVTLTNSLQYGVQWQFLTGGSTFTLSQGQTATAVPIFPGFGYSFSNGNTINATLNALSDITTIHVVSSPKILVLNNHTASLQVGDQVPIATASAVATNDPSAPIVNSIEYRDTGVILKVTPRVNDSGLVLLDIAQEVSDVAKTATSSIDSPTIEERKVASSVAVKDGSTIALGGMIRDNTTREKAGIPWLSQIPVLGALFGNTNNNINRTELIVLLSPRVVRNTHDLDSATNELVQKLQATKPLLPPLLAR